jgi:hypothetical protein
MARTNNKLYRLMNPEAYICTRAKLRAKKFGLEFNLTKYDIKIPPVCPILNIPLVIEAGQGHLPGAPSLDRIDNSKGYIKGNVAVISHRANTLKSDITIETCERLLAYMKKDKKFGSSK